MQVKNPKYNHAGCVDCEIEHPVYGWIPFTASPDDVEQHGRELYAEAISGKFGPIAAYVPPPPPSVEQIAAGARNERDRLLAESDKYVLPDRWAMMTPEQQAAWSAYRQALRDITTQPGFPTEINWPVKPA